MHTEAERDVLFGFMHVVHLVYCHSHSFPNSFPIDVFLETLKKQYTPYLTLSLLNPNRDTIPASQFLALRPGDPESREILPSHLINLGEYSQKKGPFGPAMPLSCEQPLRACQGQRRAGLPAARPGTDPGPPSLRRFQPG